MKIISSIKKSKDFEYIRNKGKNYSGKYFIIIQAKSPQPTKSSFNIALKVSKKYSNKAVIRNKTKRIIKHIFIDIAKSSYTNYSDLMLLIIPKKTFFNAKFSDGLNDVKKMLSVSKNERKKYIPTKKYLKVNN